MKKITYAISFLFLIIYSLNINLLAEHNYDNFSLNINGLNNSRDNGRFRDDYDNSTLWTVYVSSTSECSDCKTRFWLEDYSGHNISDTYSVGNYERIWKNPKNSASRKDNYLTAEDNDAAPSKFTVKGNWDEEWGQTP